MKKQLLFLLALFACVGLFAQDAAPAPEADAADYQLEAAPADWFFTAGVAFRNFDKPKFKVSGGGSFTDLLSLNGSLVQPTNENLAAAVRDKLGTVRDTGVTRLTFASGSSSGATSTGKYAFTEKLGGTIGIFGSIWSDGALDLGFVANLSVYELDSASRSLKGGSVTFNAYDYMVGWNNGRYTVNNVKMDATGNVADASSVFSVGKSKFDMQLWVLDAGLNLGYNFDNGLRTYVAGGPTLSIADMESSSRGDHANEVEFNWGLYVAGGASYWFSESVGLAAEVRYDDGFGSVGTRYVKQSLDTLGGNVKLMVRF
ncbi:MAG: hypothetical protein II943_03405 [Victivallales bacterium]|nr:hypothetical protein [Victivallales bacterium]